MKQSLIRIRAIQFWLYIKFLHLSTFYIFVYLPIVWCVGNSFEMCPFCILRDVWIRTQRAAVASRRATNLSTHLSACPPISLYFIVHSTGSTEIRIRSLRTRQESGSEKITGIRIRTEKSDYVKIQSMNFQQK